MTELFMIVCLALSVCMMLGCVAWASPDFDQDGDVDKFDVEFLLDHKFFMARVICDGCCRGDVNRDQLVDERDLLIVLSVFGTYNPQTFPRCRESTAWDAEPCR